MPSSHLQDQVVQGAFVLSQRLRHSGHLGQGAPLLRPLCLEPAHEQLQVSFAGLSLGWRGQRSPSREAGMASRFGGATTGWGVSRASWRCASWSSGRGDGSGRAVARPLGWTVAPGSKAAVRAGERAPE